MGTDKRMNNWVTKEKDETLEESENKDDIVLGHELSDRVRVQLNDKNKEDIMDWRKQQKQKMKDKQISTTKKPNPEFYNNYYPTRTKTKKKTSTLSPLTKTKKKTSTLSTSSSPMASTVTSRLSESSTMKTYAPST